MTISKGRWPHRCCALSTTCRVHFGLIVLLVGYVCLGAYMFMVVEGPYRETREQRFDRLTQQPRRELLNTLWSLKDADRRNFTGEANAAIVDYEDVIINTYSGSASWRQWNFATCIYLAVTALTTIGYGDVAPITQTGRVLMIFYSLVGVPLNLLFLSNFGILLATYTSGKFDKIGKAVKKSGKRISKRLKWDKSVDLTDPECDQETWRENWHYRRSDAVSVTSLGQYNSAFTTMNEAPVCDISRIGAAPPNGSAARRVSYASAMNGTCQAKNEFQKVNSQSDTHTISELRDIELKVANATVSGHDLRGQSSENCADKGSAAVEMTQTEEHYHELIKEKNNVLTSARTNGDCEDSTYRSGQCLSHLSEREITHGVDDKSRFTGGESTDTTNEGETAGMEHIRSRAKELEESENKRGAEILQPIASGNCTNRTADDVAGLTNIRQIIDSGSVAKGKALGTLSVIYVIYTLLGGSFIYYTEYDWTYIDAVYCTFITLSTIGFGDLIPGKGKFKAYWAVKTLTYFVFTYVGLIIFSACFALSLDKIRYVAGKVRRKFCRTSGCSFCCKGKSVSTGDCEN